MQKLKNKIKVRMVAVIIELVLIASPLQVFALGTAYDTDKNVVVNGNNISVYHFPFVNIEPPAPAQPPAAGSFLYANYVAPIPAHDDGFGNIIPKVDATCTDMDPDPNSVIPTGTSPAFGFCAGMLKCNNAVDLASIAGCSTTTPNSCVAVNACVKAVADGYNKKIIEALQIATDAKIEDSSLDKAKANEALKACGGDLACINNVLSSLRNDSSFIEKENSNSDANVPLTAAGLSDLINSNNTNQPTNNGPINTATNDQGGLLGKTQGPKVDVTFNSTGMSQIGSKMTAVAIPSFFNGGSDPKNLYFTWYLKRQNCELTVIEGEAVNKSDADYEKKHDLAKCDLDSDDEITENDWKIAATRIIVAKSFDRTEADYTKSIDEKLAGFEAVPSPKNEWTINKGDEDNSVSAPNCYVQAPKSGRIYELRKVTPTFDDDCPTNYHRACVSDQIAKCDVLNPLFRQADADAAAAAVPPVIYPISKKIVNDFGACAVASEKSDDDMCTVDDDAALKDFKTTTVCGIAGTVPLCVKDDNSNIEFKDNAQKILGVVVGTIPTAASEEDNNNKMCAAVAKPDLVNSDAVNKLFLTTNRIVTDAQEKCSVVQDKLINGENDDKGAIIITGNANLAPKCSFKKDVNLCKHLFPNFPKSKVTVDGNAVDLSGSVTGDGKFTAAEKQFWGANPETASTNGTGKDEENVVGLGVDKFEWMFAQGDQVGVVVEGDGVTPSDHANDAKFQRMWAFSMGECSALDNIEDKDTIDKDDPDKNKRGFYIDGSKGILTAEVDLNDCLRENLLEPEISSSSKLTVKLNASPQNPINDPNGSGDTLNVVAGATNTQDVSGLLYSWTIQKSLDGSTPPIDTTNWIDITKKESSEYPGWNGYSFAAAGTEGLGKKNFSVDLNLPSDLITSGISADKYKGVFYLKVKVKISGSNADGSQDAVGETMPIRVKQQENGMRVYPVTALDSGMVTLNKGLPSSSLELCSEQQEKTRCYVTKNQILGLEVPDEGSNKLTNFSWTVNGNEYSCGADISAQCSLGGNKLFVPVLGNEGESVEVVAKAASENGETVEVSRHFVITKQGLQISSQDPNSFCGIQCLDSASVCPKYLGFYRDFSGAQYADCSNQVWQTTEGKIVTLSAGGQTGFDWAVDGQIIPEFKDQNQIQLQIDKMAGESYNIGLSTHLLADNKKQLSNVSLALYKNWGITPEDTIEENQSTNIQLDVVSGSGQFIASARPTSFGASLITHLPEQLMFLLKISLTSILLLLATGLLFAFIPETLFKEERQQ